MKAIKTSYRGPTNSRGSRIIASDGDGNKITIHYDHSLNIDELHRKAARALCDKMKWKGQLVMGWLKNDAVHVFKD
jgi:hypothetical protein